MNLIIDVDARALSQSFNRAPKVVSRKIQDWVETTSATAERHVKMNEVPVDMGLLQNSIHQYIQPLNAIIKPNTEYMYWVHDGAKSPHAPMKLRNSSYQGNPFMTRTFEKIRPDAERDGQKLLDEIVRTI